MKRHILFLSLILMFVFSLDVFSYSSMDFDRLLRTNSCKKCDLEGAPLSGANLTGADMSGSSLRGANLQKATLYRAILPSRKYWIGTNFSGAMWIDGEICRQGSIGRCICRSGKEVVSMSGRCKE